ncbi:uncharacterized protein N7473_004549 [Penicillium subrubescens]|uniref:F-box domain-containing protein n=1 Tax=Penicillium subrubescens TaxID=1316194 RepID=A0A1Q5TQG8_9EURO|nr:uncharacterized protein N7473_004549 [Penicillium subrubescens]KAJ5900479.1 hypothetical protein N7473_004549 [Penicillium subrubescens]OKP02478.1 hypothetical protein PENSUB_7011 [Penicillium subrubescens]
MQSEPTAVSQHTPPVDSSQSCPHPIQHGNDFDDVAVSGLLHSEETGDCSALGPFPPGTNSALLSDIDSAPPSSPVQRVIEYENAGTPSKKKDDTDFQVSSFEGHSNLPLETLPNEVLTHILSHLPPQSLSAITLVSRRFHALVTTPHAWRIAFSRFFPGPQAADNGRRAPTNPEDLISDRRFFARLTALASWRSEYILRTRLMRSLSRGKPAQFQPSKRQGAVRSATSRNGSAVATYTSQLLFPVSHIHGSFSNSEKEPNFIHGASEQGVASASDPSAVKVTTWGISDHQMFRHFADSFPGDAPYGLGAGDMIGVPNSMDVSQPYGMIYGEGCPQGRSYFISTSEQRGRFLAPSELGSHPKLGIPAVNMITHAVCSVWIAKSPSILKATGGLIAMMTGSSSGILSAYAMGPHPTYEKRYERGQVTAKWVLSPGVPIIGIAVDDGYSTKRHAQRRIWAVALNALGEIFYLTDPPKQPEVPSTAKLNAEQFDELAWRTGRTVRWELVELSRRTARPDPFNRDPVDGSYSPRSSSDSMLLEESQIAAETKEIEKFLSFKPKHFRKVCEGWNMRCDLQVDFAGDDGCGYGESVVVIARGEGETEKASVRRYVRVVSKADLKSSPSAPGGSTPSLNKVPTSLFGGLVTSSSSTPTQSFPPSRSSSRFGEQVRALHTEWRISDFTFGDRKFVEVTATAIDNSMFATVIAQEDPLLAMSGSSFSSATSSPMLPHMEQPRSSLEVPGQRARYLAVGTANGGVFVWDIRASPAQSPDVINSIAPLRFIQTESPQVSCVALTSLYLVHGGNDGLVQAWDPLASSTRPIRTVNSRFSSRARRRLVQAEASMLGVGSNYFATGAICLDPDPTILRGMVSLGTHLRYWSYSSSGADQYKCSKRRLRRSQRGSNGAADGQRFTTSGRGAIRDFIEDERIELKRQEVEIAKERAHLSARFGVDLLGPDIDEEQLLLYAQLLSEEAYTAGGDVAKRDGVEQTAIASSATSTSVSDAIGPSSFGLAEVSSSSSPYQDPVEESLDDDLAEAIRLSLLDEQSSFPPEDLTPSIPIKYAKGVHRPRNSSPGHNTGPESSQKQEMDDLEFAIQLSLAEDKSRGDVTGEEWEEFPALASGPLSSSQSSGKGKGKARAC